MKHPVPVLPLLFLLFSLICGESANARQADAAVLDAHTRFLSHDLLEGRGTASRGESLAALYIAARFREYGLGPLPGQPADYTLPVALTAYHFENDGTWLKVRSSEGERTVYPPVFYHPGGSPEAFRDFGGELLWMGPAEEVVQTMASYGSLEGKVPVMGPPWGDLSLVRSELIRRGAEGVIEVVPNPFYDRLRVVRGPVRYALDSGVRDTLNQSPLPGVVTGSEGLEALGLADLFTGAGTEPGIRELGRSVEAHFDLSSEKKTAKNVAAFLQGTDPELRDKIVIFLAHYDHVGFGEPAEADSIWNGFADNSAGTAMVLELARMYGAAPPSHSVLFLLTSAEEQGPLGANQFVYNPPVPLDRIAAVINLDGGAPPPEEQNWNLAASPDAGITAFLNSTPDNRQGTVEILPINSHSDHWPFHRAGIPAYFLYPSSQASPGMAHTPNDEWRADFPFEGLVRYTEVAFRLGERIGEYLEQERDR